jgi:hypothetical protein
MRQIIPLATILIGLVCVPGCERSAKQDTDKPASPSTDQKTETGADHDHAHDEVSIGTVTIGGMEVEVAQGHGKVEAGKQGHLIVKLPYNDGGASIVRAWLGTDDRTRSLVGKGEYAASHDDYDVHAVAPDPLPENVMWWIEIEKPDGAKVVGSVKPLMD